MKRRVIRLGAKTLLVSLPSKWAREHGIEKGHELEVQPHGQNLVVRAGPTVISPAEIDITGYDSSLIWYSMTAAYRQGVDNLTIKFSEPKVWDMRALKNIPLQHLLHNITEQLMGWGIAQTKSSKVEIKDLSQTKKEEFAPSVTRTFQTLLTFAEDLTYAIENNEADTVETLAENADRQVNRLVNFSLRLLAKHQPANLSTYHLLVNLEGAGDVLTDIARSAQKISWKEHLNAFEDATALMRANYENHLNPTREKMLAIEARKFELNSTLENMPEHQKALLKQLRKFIMESVMAHPAHS